ncbi:hypothetical protein K432DRAFT_382552 [Lepidopterella palustris CBS 459.81]|uniref:Uncharacterized protein n=1 Tax=Lepidopterella palustris CBS 459.81 TaxID=1314670 RepID=A0A8E2E9T0_9PEZI|nr:hypothetical protein K432DRAFT_382552 [Lepidopterella palustris CBS 459.81]
MLYTASYSENVFSDTDAEVSHYAPLSSHQPRWMNEVAKPAQVRKKEAPDKTSAKAQPTLLPSGRTGQPSRSVADRIKHPRLYGAIYMLRGWARRKISKKPPSSSSAYFGEIQLLFLQYDSSSDKKPSSIPSNLSSLKPSTGSLHGELVNPHYLPKLCPEAAKEDVFDRRSVLSSRPCYRCISYMDSGGIKPVFWTNYCGE